VRVAAGCVRYLALMFGLVRQSGWTIGTGGRRQAAGGRRQAAGGRRQATGVKTQNPL